MKAIKRTRYSYFCLLVFVVTTWQQTIAQQHPPFLYRPYNYNDVSQVTSFFDHHNPTSSVSGGLDGTIELFHGGDSISVNHASVNLCAQLGYDCYPGHNGFDYDVPPSGDCDALCAADGVLDKIETNSVTGYGNYAKIKHDVDGDGTTDYYTLYAHLKTNSIPFNAQDVATNLFIPHGTKVGIIGETGVNGEHLHFELIDSNHKVIDPYGWWGTGPDPWQDARALHD
ncbi:MAG: peptidoglycan DD-metalloendopeptidase family protein [Kiritimatiellae bacterium]|nr:peptidoglycan DD-metalloendopeptidase family protein [Kiritimatiellia bacterium]